MSITDILTGKWNQLAGQAKITWGKLTDDEIAQIAGNKDILLGKLQEKYGWTKEEAESQISDFYENIKSQFEDKKDDAENLWDSLVTKAKTLWADFNDEDLAEIKKDKDALLEKIATKYEITKEDAMKKIEELK